MAVAPPPARGAQAAVRAERTSPLRILAADHQPIRLLAELEGISPAEIVHRAMQLYLDLRRDDLSSLASQTQRMVRAGNFEGLAQVLNEAANRRQAARAERVRQLGRPKA